MGDKVRKALQDTEGKDKKVKKQKEDAREEIWKKFKDATSTPNQLVHMHTHNHHTLVFGWREYNVRFGDANNTNKLRREVLAVRGGQNPFGPMHIWIPFDKDRVTRIKVGTKSEGPRGKVYRGKDGRTVGCGVTFYSKAD